MSSQLFQRASNAGVDVAPLLMTDNEDEAERASDGAEDNAAAAMTDGAEDHGPSNSSNDNSYSSRQMVVTPSHRASNSNSRNNSHSSSRRRVTPNHRSSTLYEDSNISRDDVKGGKKALKSGFARFGVYLGEEELNEITLSIHEQKKFHTKLAG